MLDSELTLDDFAVRTHHDGYSVDYAGENVCCRIHFFNEKRDADNYMTFLGRLSKKGLRDVVISALARMPTDNEVM